MEVVYNYLLTQFNDNTDNLVYKGNYIFRFHQDSMSVYEAVTNKLVNTEVPYSMVSVLTRQPVPFVENNERIDWLIELGFVVRMEGQEFDSTTDLDYANIKSVMDDLQGQAVTISGKRYSFKTQEPQYSGYTVLGNSKYAILTCTLNVTQITLGYFGQDSKWYIDDEELDVTQVDITATRRYYTADKKNDNSNDYNEVIGRAMVFNLTFNYISEATLLNESRGGLSTFSTTHVLKEVFNGITTFTWNVTIQVAAETQIRGGVKKLTIRCLEI